MTLPGVIANFFRELKRRRVVRAAVVYGLVAAGVVQLADAMFPALQLPEWAFRLLVALVILGFPIVLALEWVFEITSEGVRAERADAGGAASALSPAPRRRRTKKKEAAAPRWAFLAGAAVAILAIIGAAMLSRRAGDSADAPEIRSVAVLPFTNLSGDPENEYFSDGVTEDIITQLSKISGLTVISRTSVMRYKNTQKSVREIAQELGVGAVLEGSVRRAGDEVRIVAQLINPEDEGHLWAETYDRQLSSIFAIQSEVAQAIAGALRTRLTSEDRQRLGAQPTGNVGAYDYYLRARDFYYRYSRPSNARALELFREALALDPDYALAYAGLGDAYAQQAIRYGYGPEWLDTAIVYSQRAIELGPDLAEGYKALGLAYLGKGWIERAADANRKALERNPNYDPAVGNLGFCHHVRGALAEAARWFDRDIALNPALGFTYSIQALNLLLLGNVAGAEDYIRKGHVVQPGSSTITSVDQFLHIVRRDTKGALELTRKFAAVSPDTLEGLRQLGEAEFHDGNYAEAIRYLDRSALQLVISGTFTMGRSSVPALAFSLLRTGKSERARTLFSDRIRQIEALLANGNETPGLRYELAEIHAAQGNHDDAYVWLERAVAGGWRGHLYMDVDPLLEGLRGEARYQQVVQEMKRIVELERQKLRRRG